MLLIEKTTRAHYTVLTAFLSLKLFQNEKFTLKKFKTNSKNKWDSSILICTDTNIYMRY